jgi:hypothetical protein
MYGKIYKVRKADKRSCNMSVRHMVKYYQTNIFKNDPVDITFASLVNKNTDYLETARHVNRKSFLWWQECLAMLERVSSNAMLDRASNQTTIMADDHEALFDKFIECGGSVS